MEHDAADRWSIVIADSKMGSTLSNVHVKMEKCYLSWSYCLEQYLATHIMLHMHTLNDLLPVANCLGFYVKIYTFMMSISQSFTI